MFAFLLLLLCYWLSGFGVLTLLRMRLKPVYMLTLGLLVGVAVASFVPWGLQLLNVVITGPTVFGALAAAALVLNIPSFLRMRREGVGVFTRPLRPVRFRMRLYELPYWLVIGFMIFVSVWRCYYLPPTSRDALSGPEAIAEFTVREQTMVNSFFNIDLSTTNNQFKSPFLISLQVIYKLAGFPFGQVWLSVIFVCFTVVVYHILKERVHPVLAGLLLLLFLMTPEIYAYTFMILYDYSNMVFFCLGLYFLRLAVGKEGSAGRQAAAGSEGVADRGGAGSPAVLSFAGLLLGIATYIRSETLILVMLFLPVIGWGWWRSGKVGGGLPGAVTWRKAGLAVSIFLLPSLVGYYLPVQLYNNHYLPVHYEIGGLVNKNWADWQSLWQRYSDIVTRLLFGTFSIRLWGYLVYIFSALFLAELVFVRRFSREACFWLYSIVVVFLALGVLGTVLPVFDLVDTTKRALFKIMPLLVFYLANNELLLRLSRRISAWEVVGGEKAADAAGSGGSAGAVAPKVAPVSSKLGAAKAVGGGGAAGSARSGGAAGSAGSGGGVSRKKNRRK